MDEIKNCNCGKQLPNNWVWGVCDDCDLKWHKEQAIEQEKQIIANGKVPMYRLDDIDHIFPIGYLTIEEVNKGFNSLFG